MRYYLLESLAYFVIKHKASNKKSYPNIKRHFLYCEEQIQTLEEPKRRKLDIKPLESRNESLCDLRPSSLISNRLAKDDPNTTLISTNAIGISNIQKKKNEESEFEQLKKAVLLVNRQNSLMQIFVAILTRLLYFRIPINKLLTGYYKMLLSRQGRKIIDQENENLQLKTEFTTLIRYGCDYSVACVKEIERQSSEDEDTTSASHEETADSTSNNAHTQKDGYALKMLLHDYTNVFYEIFPQGLRTFYNSIALIQLTTTIAHYSTLFNKHFSQFYNDYLITPPAFLSNVHPYFTTMEIVPETHIIYWIMDWILYTVLNDNFLDLKITIVNLAPNGILVKGVIYAFTTMLNKQEIVIMLKNGGFLENWADNLSSALIEQLENGCLFSVINDLKEALNAVEKQGLLETAYERAFSIEDSKKEQENFDQLKAAVLKFNLYFFDITKNVFDKIN